MTTESRVSELAAVGQILEPIPINPVRCKHARHVGSNFGRQRLLVRRCHMDGCSPVQHVRLPCAIREPLSKTAALSEIRIHRAMEAHDVGNVRAKCLSICRELRKQEEGVDANKV